MSSNEKSYAPSNPEQGPPHSRMQRYKIPTSRCEFEARTNCVALIAPCNMAQENIITIPYDSQFKDCRWGLNKTTPAQPTKANPTHVLLCRLNSTKVLDRSPAPNAKRPPKARNPIPVNTQAGPVHQDNDTSPSCSSNIRPTSNPSMDKPALSTTPMVRGVSEAFLSAKFLGRDHAQRRR